jgi:pyruvate,water dikinase
MPARADPDPLDRDPLHEVVEPGSAWTRVNISEAIPGVPTPLTWSFWFPVQELGILGAWHDLGVAKASEVRIAERPEERLGAIFYGRPAANLDLMRRMADRIPGTSGDALEHQLLGSRRADAVSETTRARLPVIALKLPYTAWRLTERLRRLRAEIEPWWRHATGPDAARDEDALTRDLRSSHAAFLRVMRPHAAASNVAQLCYEQVRRLAEQAGRPDLEATLVS